jgi:Pyruvate/2-oxoacid:ferredoxin oxidoreductase delta subunit
MTGAVKNQLGCVYGIHKARMHLVAPDVGRLGALLADINAAIAPRLYVMDAVTAMEGNGPRGGTPRHIGAILASADPVALDSTACRLIALDPAFVPTSVAGESRGYGFYQSAMIEIVGEAPEDFMCPDFKVVRFPARRHLLTQLDFIRDRIEPRPVIDNHLCQICGVCVDVCPVPDKAVRSPDEYAPPVIDYQKCIRCLCCQETCPHRAIRVDTPLLGRLLPYRRAPN